MAVSGGAGTRLWPLSTEDRPKQFHSLGADRSLLQETVCRIAAFGGVTPLPPILVCNQRHAALAREQLQAVGCRPGTMLLEPFGRNTAAVAMAVSLIAEQADPDALVLLMPADHLMSRPEAFASAIAEAAPLAGEHFVLFGVVPTAPETGYGYIEAGEPLAGRLAKVARFVEKPTLETAQAFLEGGRHLWNAGIFMFSPRLLIAEMERLQPEVAEATRAALAAGVRQGEAVTLDAEAFAACPSVSIDYAVMERTDKAAVIPMDAGWADIGSWSALWGQGPHDDHGNVVRGEAELIDCEGCLVWSEGKAVGAIGLSDLVIVQTEDAVVVAPKSRAQDIRKLVERMTARGGK